MANGSVAQLGAGVSWAPKTPPARTSMVPALIARACISVNSQILMGMLCTNKFPYYPEAEMSVHSVTICRILVLSR
jgi:hypothetical protein